MEVLHSFKTTGAASTQARGLKLLSEILNRCGSIKNFTEKYLEDQKNLEFVISKIDDENIKIRNAAFELLVIYLYTPKEMKGHEVNNLLMGN
mmetsp:Transcript_593/g.669  ORF Transcript_593/g.669 Transcript_593/m.669 type:complete len:92 (+) Transcript_593:495-770(+)